MIDRRITAEVHVVKAGPNGRPQAQVHVDANISAANLGALLHNVVTNEKVLTLAGLKGCGGCKSGLDLNIFDRFQDVINVEIQPHVG
jgi:hypothetical protein